MKSCSGLKITESGGEGGWKRRVIFSAEHRPDLVQQTDKGITLLHQPVLLATGIHAPMGFYSQGMILRHISARSS